MLVSQRGEQDQDVGATCVCLSAVFESVCVDLCDWLWIYVYMHCIYVYPYASQLDGCGDVVLQRFASVRLPD